MSEKNLNEELSAGEPVMYTGNGNKRELRMPELKSTPRAVIAGQRGGRADRSDSQGPRERLAGAVAAMRTRQSVFNGWYPGVCPSRWWSSRRFC